MRPIAAEAGLTRPEYMKLSPVELDEYITGYIRRQEREWDRAAFIAATMANLFSKRKIKPEKMLGRKLLKYFEKPQQELTEIEKDIAKLDAVPEMDNGQIGSVISFYRDIHKRTGSRAQPRPVKNEKGRGRNAKGRGKSN